MPEVSSLQTGADPADPSDPAQELLRARSRSTPGVLAPIMPRERARQKLATGVPLLHGEQLDPDEPFCRDLFQRLLNVLRRQPATAAASAEIEHAVASARLDLGRALEEALAGHADHLAELAAWARVDGVLLSEVLELAVQPSLQAVATAYRPLLDHAGRWNHGYCPVCGAQTEPLADDAPSQAGRLRCPRCAAEWVSPSDAAGAPIRSFRLELGEHEPDEALEDLLELD